MGLRWKLWSATYEKMVTKPFFKRANSIEKRNQLWRLRFVSVSEIRKVANVIDDGARLLEIMWDLEAKSKAEHQQEQKDDNSEFLSWENQGKTNQYGYLYEVEWIPPVHFVNQALAPIQKNTRHASILFRIGESCLILENMKHELKMQLRKEIFNSCQYHSTFTTASNNKCCPISTSIWLHGGKALMQELNIDVSNWEEQGKFIFHIQIL